MNRTCIACGADSAPFRCTCKTIHYCGKKCQKQHWKAHRVECPAYLTAKAAKEEKLVQEMARLGENKTQGVEASSPISEKDATWAVDLQAMGVAPETLSDLVKAPATQNNSFIWNASQGQWETKSLSIQKEHYFVPKGFSFPEEKLPAISDEQRALLLHVEDLARENEVEEIASLERDLLELVDKAGVTFRSMFVLGTLGASFLVIGQGKAIEYFKRSMEIGTSLDCRDCEGSEDVKSCPHSLGAYIRVSGDNLARSYENTGQIDEAIEESSKWRKIARSMEDKLEECRWYLRLADLYAAAKQHNQACEVSRQALVLAQELNDVVHQKFTWIFNKK